MADLNIKDVARLVGVAIATINRWLQADYFPPPSYCIHKKRWWRREVVERWMNEPRRPKPGRPRRIPRPEGRDGWYCI